jgi:anti-sigma-K factor RskA
MSDHEELENLVAAWVLGALEPDQETAVRTHVDGCATCREVATRLRRVVGALPLTVEEVAPPARLRERVLSAAAATAPRAAGKPRDARPGRPRPSVQTPLSRIPIYAAAAIAVLSLLAGLLLGQAFRVSSPQQASQVARFTLSGHQDMSGAQASVVDLKNEGVALADFRGLPPPGAGRVYEVWLIRDGSSAEPVTVFVPDSNGAKVVLINRSLAGYSVMAVTNEPGPDGSDSPSQQPQLYGNVA